MKNFYICILVYAYFGAHRLSAGGGGPLQFSGTSGFTENKGQVSDQYNQPRTDVLFSGSVNNLAFHLRQNGISYQLHHTEAVKRESAIPAFAGKKYGVPALGITLYRVDISWLNCRENAMIEKGESLPGFSNYYHEVCPGGVLNVRSFKTLLYKSLYKGIDLHWTSQGGQLKYEYLVKADADYKQIAWKVEGAKKIYVDRIGNLIMSTPLGDLVEERPLVLQDGKTFAGNWIVTGNQLSFDIPGIDVTRSFVIDPLVRLWATYFGGSDYDGFGYGCSDTQNNTYVAGATLSMNNIASTGAHQAIYGGPGTGSYPGDGLVIKFDPSGNRLWSTYYGGNGSDFANGCSVDASGNLYFAGGTTTTNSLVMVTPGCYQPVTSGNAVLGDALIVKLDASGARLWATYYGDTDGDIGLSCSVDPNGDLFVTGGTEKGASTTTAMASPGAHQPQHGSSTNGDADIFIAKFSSSGARLWGTYYGGPVQDFGFYCVADLTGNVYVTGETRTTASGVIATTACHQYTLGGNLDAYLVKFDGSGNRLWGTYYGGWGDELGGTCAIDQLNNVYLSGATASQNNISTPGTHKTANPFGRDGFLVKFNPAGVRQFATYYGGTDPEDWISCIVDKSNNIYLAGITATGTSTDIATACSYQPNYGGGFYDCFLAKMDTTGNRIWGTYYGGAGEECEPGIGYWPGVFVDQADNVYLIGVVNGGSSTLSIASAGAYQTQYGGGDLDGFLVKFDGCRGIIPPPNTSLFTCTNKPATLTAAQSCTTAWYSVPKGGTALALGTLNTQSLTSNTTYYAEDLECGSVSPRTAVTVTVLPLPTIGVSAQPQNFCAGETVTYSAHGATSYTWAFLPPVVGSSATLAPTFSYTYMVVGTSSAGCENNFVFAVVVVPCDDVQENAWSENSIMIYPNPSEGEFTVSADRPQELILLNSLGQALNKINLTEINGQKAVVKDLPAGIYFLSVKTEQGSFAKKIVIR